MLNERQEFVERITPEIVEAVKALVALNQPCYAPSVLVAIAYLQTGYGTKQSFRFTESYFSIPYHITNLCHQPIKEQVLQYCKYLNSNLRGYDLSFKGTMKIFETKDFGTPMFRQSLRNIVKEYNLTVFDRCVFPKEYDE